MAKRRLGNHHTRLNSHRNWSHISLLRAAPSVAVRSTTYRLDFPEVICVLRIPRKSPVSQVQTATHKILRVQKETFRQWESPKKLSKWRLVVETLDALHKLRFYEPHVAWHEPPTSRHRVWISIYSIPIGYRKTRKLFLASATFQGLPILMMAWI